MHEFVFLVKNSAAPGLGCLIIIISTFIAKMLLTVSISVSPFEIEDPVFEKFITSALNLFSANSKDNFVLVEFSKNRLAIVIPVSVGTFFIFLFKISLKLSAVSKIKLISSFDRYFTPKRFLTEICFIIIF